MGWVSPSTRSTGDIITASIWNVDLVDNLTFLEDRIVWLATSVAKTLGLNQTSTSSWADVDLTGDTSSAARYVLGMLELGFDSMSAGSLAILEIRRNGDTSFSPRLVGGANYGNTAGNSEYENCICGMDSGQVIEWRVQISGTIQVDCYLRIFGYIEGTG